MASPAPARPFPNPHPGSRSRWRAGINTWSGVLVISFLLNLMLFSLLPGLITRVSKYDRSLDPTPSVNVVRIKQPETLVRKKEKKPEEIEKPKKQRIIKSRLRQRPARVPFPFESPPSLPVAQGGISLPSVDMSVMPGFRGVYDMGEVDGPLVPLSQAPPIYPMRAKRKGIEGWVEAEMLISEDGYVEKVTVLNAAPKNVFEKSAINCTSAWRFTGGTVSGVPVKTRAVITLRFNLENE